MFYKNPKVCPKGVVVAKSFLHKNKWMKFTAVILMFMFQVAAGQTRQDSPKTVDITDQLFIKMSGRTWKSYRYVGKAALENYNYYRFSSTTELLKQYIEDGQKIADDKFTWSLARDPDTNHSYLTITDNITKETIIYCFDAWNSAIVKHRLLFKSDFDDYLVEELYLKNE